MALYHRWQEPVSYFDHAIFVPLVCIWMGYRVRSEKANRSESDSSDWGYLLLIAAVLLQIIGASQQITVVQGVALVCGIWACALILGGRKLFSNYRWPLLYSLLLIPIPSFFMAQLTLGMREMSTTGASAILQAVMRVLNKPFLRVGNLLEFAGHSVTIVDACSGMNTLLTVIAVGLVIVYLEKSRAVSVLTTLLLIPVAILCNLIRILILCLFVGFDQSEFAFGVGHVPIGVVTVGAAFSLLAFGIRLPEKWKNKWDLKPTPKPHVARATPQPFRDSRWRAPLRIIGIFALLFFAFVSLRIQNRAETPSTQHHADLMPATETSHWKATELPLDPATYDIVGTEDAHMFRFDPVKAQSKPIYLYWLHSENSRKIGHPPELCYRGENYDINERSETHVTLNGHDIPIVRLSVQREDYKLLVYYWYRIGGIETSSYLEHQLKWAWSHLENIFNSESIAAENTEASMTRLSTEIDPDSETRLKQWMAEAIR